MKAKSIFAASLLVAGAAFADTTTVDTEYVLGVMPVTADGKTQVILSVPWVAEGSTNLAVTVTNLVKTAGLADGDKLTWYNPSTQKYMAWEVETDGTVAPYWKPVPSWGSSSVLPAGGEAILRGEAIVLTREATSGAIYVIGQVGTSGATTTTTISATDGDGSWELLAPPQASTDAVDFNSAASDGSNWSTCVGDEITVDGANGLFKTYKCVDRGEAKNPRYVWATSKYAKTPTAMIPAGRGFWYHRAANKDELTITWYNVPNN